MRTLDIWIAAKMIHRAGANPAECRSQMSDQGMSSSVYLRSVVPSEESESPPLACTGWTFIVSGVVVPIVFIYCAIVSKLVPASGVPWLDAVGLDWYYSLLVPLTLPVTVVAVYLHWLSMKLFKHA